jgi:hypothetical protein
VLSTLQALEGGGRDHAAVGHGADPAHGKAAAQAVDHGQQHPDIGCVARRDLGADRPSLGVDDHAQDQLHQVGPVVLRVAPLPERLPARALEAERGGVQEDDGELAEQVAAVRKQRFLDLVFDAARGKGRRMRLAAIRGVQLLPEPSHGAVEVVQRQAVHTRDGVVLDPPLAGPVGTGDEEPVQDGGEYRTLDLELEAAVGEQLLDHRPAAGPLPQSLEQQGAADATGGQAQPLGIPLEGGEQHDLVAEAGAGGEQAGQRAGGGELVGAAEGGEDVLAVRPVLPTVLHDLQVGARPGGLEAEEHGRWSGHHNMTRFASENRMRCDRTWHHIFSAGPALEAKS